MSTITLTSKGQLTIPHQLRQALGLAAGARLQASIDAHGRLVLVPSRYEPEELFRHRPPYGLLERLVRTRGVADDIDAVIDALEQFRHGTHLADQLILARAGRLQALPVTTICRSPAGHPGSRKTIRRKQHRTRHRIVHHWARTL